MPRINMFRNDWFVVKFLLASLFIVLVLGCASEDVTVESPEAADPATSVPATATSVPATATSVPPTATSVPPTATSVPPTATTEVVKKYPQTVKDLLNRDVEIAQVPERVVALSPTALEYIYAIGGEAVGRPSSANYPEEAMGVEGVGTAYAPNFEAVLSLNPDLVIADSVIHAQPAILENLTGLPAPVFMAGAGSYGDVLTALENLGVAFDLADEANQEIDRIQSAMDSAKAAAASDITAVVLIADRDNSLYAAKNTSFIGDVISEIGITNVAAEQPDGGPFPGFSAAPFETMLMWDPDFIFTITPAPEPAPRLSTLLPQIPPLRGLGAVRSSRVIELSNDLALRSPGPRVDQLIETITDTLAQ